MTGSVLVVQSHSSAGAEPQRPELDVTHFASWRGQFNA